MRALVLAIALLALAAIASAQTSAMLQFYGTTSQVPLLPFSSFLSIPPSPSYVSSSPFPTSLNLIACPSSLDPISLPPDSLLSVVQWFARRDVEHDFRHLRLDQVFGHLQAHRH